MNKKGSTISALVSAYVLRVLVVLGMLLAPGINPALAQEANPPVPVITPQPVGYGVIPMEQQAAESLPEATPTVVENADAGELSEADYSDTNTEEPAPEAQPELQIVEPLTPRNTAMQGMGMQVMGINSPNLPEVQGVVLLDVAVPDTTGAGETLTYTYRYSNTSASPVHNVVVDASWSNFIGTTQQQKCYDIGCPAIFVDGPTVITSTPPSTANMRYVIGTLAGNQSGNFSVIMRVDAADYPKTGQAIARPAGSGKLYRDNNYSTLISDDTANTMIVGPVLVLTKTATSVSPIYTGQSAEFNIRLGNASATGDQVGGSIRADARPGTNVVLKDSYPKGADFVSATGPYVKDDVSRIVTWTFPSLAVGTFQDLKVVFRKVDSTDDCTTLDNDSYEATSNEYPFQSASKRYVVRGAIASVPVVPPLQTPYITPTVSTLYYGNDTIITITVRNHYTAALTNIVMKYVLPENLGYLNFIGADVPISLPVTALGGEVGWRFDLPAAATKTIPAIKTFAILVRGAFFDSSQDGRASLVSSGNTALPITCAFKVGGPNVKPRMVVVKTTTEPERFSSTENAYLAERNEAFPFVITVTNRSQADVAGLTITDTLPGKASEPGANMSYVPDSGLLDGVLRNPDVIVNGYAGKLVWHNLSIPANGVLVLHYRLTIQGRDFYKYCNTVKAGLQRESFDDNKNSVCIKINPDIELAKTADRAAAGPGEEVIFTLRVTNHETETHTVGLFDKLGKFAFVRQVSGYAQPVTVSSPLAGLMWPLVSLDPGQTLETQIVARMPDENCAQTQYENEVLFGYRSEGADYLVQQIPPYKVAVKCAAIEANKTANRTTVSLRDLMTFTLTLRNLNPADVLTNVQAVDVMPLGFSFVANAPTSEIQTLPTQTVRADGRTQLTWLVGNVGGAQTRSIRFLARASDTVGSFENWLTSQSSVTRRCVSNCRGELENGAVVTYTALPLVVQAMNTIAPQVLETACARPGDTRTYRLTMVNTNVHSYENITITAALPMGLRFSRAISGTTTPQLIAETDGRQTVRWVGQRINAKPNGVFAAQVEYWMELSVGNVLGDLPTVATATSADGLIPRKDDATDPSVPVCVPNAPVMLKAANVSRVMAGGEVVYQITLANPTGSPLSIFVSDPLPGNFSYLGMVSGPEPVVNGSILSWDNVNVPAVGGQPGLAKLVFRTQSNGETNQVYTNTAQGSVGVDATNALAEVFLAAPLSNLTGVVFNDANDNGVRDGAETGIANATVTLTLSSGAVVTQTNGQGAYGFYGLTAGNFTVQVGPRANLGHTSPQSVNGNLTAGVTTTVDFGFGTLPTISVGDVSMNEGDLSFESMSFAVTLSKPALVPVMVDFATANGTATSATGDYLPRSGTLTFSIGETSAVITVPVHGETLYEPNETLLLNLSAAANAAIADGQGVGTIVNDDPVPVGPLVTIGQLGGQIYVSETNSGFRVVVLTVTMASASSVPVTVTYEARGDSEAVNATVNEDFLPLVGAIVFAPGQTVKNLNLQIRGDTVFESNEALLVHLTGATNGTLGVPSVQLVGILNDDAPVYIIPTISITCGATYEGNTGKRIVPFTVTLSSGTGYTVSFLANTNNGTAVSGSDYEPKGFSVPFLPGMTQWVLSTDVLGDTEFEPNETYDVKLSGLVSATLAPGASPSAACTIFNDDLPPGVVPRAYLPLLRK